MAEVEGRIQVRGNLRAAIAEKHERMAQHRIVADRVGDGQVELWRQQARVGHAKRALLDAGSDRFYRQFCRSRLLEEIEVCRDRIAIAQEWGVA
jgi:hypothetical protein